jgi:hypothetical protein
MNNNNGAIQSLADGAAAFLIVVAFVGAIVSMFSTLSLNI